MATTTRLAIPYPTPDDDVDVPQDMQALAEKLDAVVAIPDAGDLKFSARKNEHGNWIKADGRALAVGEYAPLRAALIADGSPYGADAGNPRIPSMVERVPVGAGGAYAHGVSGGSATHVLTSAQMPAHSHPIPSLAVLVSADMATGSYRDVQGGAHHQVSHRSHNHGGATGTGNTSGASAGGAAGAHPEYAAVHGRAVVCLRWLIFFSAQFAGKPWQC